YVRFATLPSTTPPPPFSPPRYFRFRSTTTSKGPGLSGSSNQRSKGMAITVRSSTSGRNPRFTAFELAGAFERADVLELPARFERCAPRPTGFLRRVALERVGDLLICQRF